MIRLIGSLLKLGLLIAAVVWVADRSGRATIAWGDVLVETSTLALVVGVGMIAYASYTAARLVSGIQGIPSRLRMRRALARRKKGEKLLSRAVYALADDKKSRAKLFLGRAEKLLGPTPGVVLARTQAGALPALSGAEGDYGSPFAWREAVENSLQAGKLAQAQALAEKFAARHGDLALSKKLLFDVHARGGRWDQARQLLDDLRQIGALPRREARRMQAAVLAERARLDLERGHAVDAFEYAHHAGRLRPQWAPAIHLAAAALAAQNKPREAASLIARAWATSPHPQLGALYLSLYTGKNDLKKAEAVENMTRRAASHPASRLLRAEALFRAGIYAQARHWAAELAKTHPSRDVARLLSRVAGAEHDVAASQLWQARAVEAPPGEAWICSSCRQPHKDWQALCTNCHAFNTLDWEKQLAVIAAS